MSDMTNAAAIDLLDNLILMMFEDDYESDYDTALRMAIDALKTQADTDTVSRQAARMCLTGDVTNMSIEQYIKMVDKRLEQLQPSPSRPSEQHISSLETPCDHCYFFTHKCTYPGKCADRAILEAAHEGGER